MKQNNRILALDILRGITVAGMIMVNNPGSWSHIYKPLDHAEWIGLTPTDLVFPFFMFIMGVSSYISLRKYDFKPTGDALMKVLRRTVLIFLVGVAIGWFSRFCNYWNHPTETLGFGGRLLEALWNFDHMRILGVMQRLALCYGITALLALTLNHKRFPVVIVGILAVYTLVLLMGNGFVYGEENILSVVDRAILTPDHMYNDNGIDPEGVLSTLPAVAHTMIGFLVGKMIFTKERDDMSREEKLERLMTKLLIAGTSLTLAGWLLSYGCPISKKVWSPTFVLVTTGMASCLLALLIFVVDVKGRKRWGVFFETFGVNPLFMYVLGDIFAIVFGAVHFTAGGMETNIIGYSYTHILSPVFGLYGGSLVYALLFVMLNWAVGYPLYKKKIYIKL